MPRLIAPEVRSVHLVGVEDRSAGDSGVGGIPAAGSLMQDDLELAIPVKIGDRGVARTISGNRLDRDLEVVVFPRARGLRRVELHTVQHRTHEVFERPAGVHAVIDMVRRPGDRRFVRPHRRAAARPPVEVESDRLGIGAEEPPADVHRAARLLDRHDAAAEVLHPARREGGRRTTGRGARTSRTATLVGSCRCLRGRGAGERGDRHRRPEELFHTLHGKRPPSWSFGECVDEQAGALVIRD